MKQLLSLEIGDLIDSPYQGRLFSTSDSVLSDKDQVQISELQNSIQTEGMINPILVRHSPEKQGKFEIIDGHRRVIAAKKLNMTHIDAFINDLTDQQAQVQTIIANLQRKNLSLIENAIAFEKCLNQNLFSSKAQLSKAIGKDETYVGDVLNLMKMDQRIINDLVQNKSLNDVRILRTIRNAFPLEDGKNRNEKQYELYQTTIEQKFSRKHLYNYIELIKAQSIMDDNGLNADNIDLNNAAVRNEIINKNRNRNVDLSFGTKKIKASFDLVGLDNDTKQVLKTTIENHIEQLNQEINKLLKQP